MTTTQRGRPDRVRQRDDGPRIDADLRERVLARLAHSDQRLTRHRERLIAVLADAVKPLTIPEIGDADPELAVSSIYRNLTRLVELNVVHRVVTAGDFAHYELAEDLTEHHHHHIVCSNCGAVEDFEASMKLEEAVREACRRVVRRTGFRIDRHVIDLIGLCAACS